MQSVARASADITPGVSHELAIARRVAISDVRYRLHFDLPTERTAAVRGEVTVTFTLDRKRDVVLDFRGDASQIHGVTVGGRASQAAVRDEHIILPAREIRRGKNSICIRFTAGDQSLNRSADYLYTLFVPDRARTVFPCFDQPDLKARYTLSLTLPEGWTAVSNTARADEQQSGRVTFRETEPLSTYLFAFAAGRFAYTEHCDPETGRTIGAYYRETDPARLAQFPEIFRQVEHSLRWQEEFTAVPYPFAKYDLVILPGFQFGGMEHTGATFYNDNTIFLSPDPTPDEVLARASLIAHETTHMWFGDYVTMRWFDDVWTKEVFANYFAAAITAPLFPEINHDLNRLKTYAAAAYSEDRTWVNPLTLSSGEVLRGGGTAIQQPLDNLANAGLVYNNIIYNKAPLMMVKLVELMGHDAFRDGVREYVRRHAYGNATWDDLVAILDAHTPQDIQSFSRVWVQQRGMPAILMTCGPGDMAGGKDANGEGRETCVLSVKQSDPHGRGIGWPQTFAVTLQTEAADTTLNITLSGDASETVQTYVGAQWMGAQFIPNSDGRGYGVFLLTPDQLMPLVTSWHRTTTGTARQAVLMNLHELYLWRLIDERAWRGSLIEALATERDALTASTLCAYLREVELGADDEARLLSLMGPGEGAHHLAPVRTQIARMLGHVATSPAAVTRLRELWAQGSEPAPAEGGPSLSERDMMVLSYELAVRLPAEADTILARGRERLVHPAAGLPNADRLREYDFIARAAARDRASLDAVFADLLTPAGRRIEPWASTVMALLNHRLRDEASVHYITPALETLTEVQRTGDIFFPAAWTRSLLSDHRCPAARRAVEDFLQQHPDYLPLRRAKILNAAYPLFR